MKNNLLKRIGAFAVCAAISVSGITAFASDETADAGVYIYDQYFKINDDSDVWKKKLSNETGMAEVRTEKSLSGDKSMYVYANNAFWKQRFDTDNGCELPDGSQNNFGIVTQGSGQRWVNFSCGSGTWSFKMSVTGDLTGFEDNTYLGPWEAGIKVKDMNKTETTDEDGTVWTTYSWEGAYTKGDNHMAQLVGIHAHGVYFDDITLKCKGTDGYWHTVISSDFETAINVPVDNIHSATATGINDSTIRISWVNPPITTLTKLQIIDITDESNPTVIYEEGGESGNAITSGGRGAKRYYDVTGLSAETYKKYKILTSSGESGYEVTFTDSETIVSGRTMKTGKYINDYNYDENGFSFGGSWQGNNGKWYVDFDNKRSGDASFAADLRGNVEHILSFYMNSTLTKDKTYVIEYYAKTADGNVPAKGAIFALCTTSETQAKGWWSIPSGEWTKYSMEYTPTSDDTLNTLRLSFKSYNPTTVYVDDIRVYQKDGEEKLSTKYSEAGHKLSDLAVSVENDGAKLTWKETTLDGDGVDGLGVNIYHTSKNGTVTKLNETPLAWVGGTCEYSLEQLNAGVYSVRAISGYGIEGNEIICEASDVNVTDVKFEKVTIWIDGFNEYGKDVDYTLPAAKLEKGDILGGLTVVNNKTETLPVSLVGALYKGSKLLKVVENKTEIEAGKKEWLAVAFQVGEEGETDVSDYTMKLFVWDSLNGMTPLSGAANTISGK